MMTDPQTLFRALVAPIGETGKALLQVRIGDLFQTQTVALPSIIGGEIPDWTKGEMRKALDAVVVSMCQKIQAHGSIFKHREDCTLVVPAMAPCPKCQAPKLEVVE